MWLIAIVFKRRRISCIASSNESSRLCAVAAVRGDWSDSWDDERDAFVDCRDRVDFDAFDDVVLDISGF